jgi:hypothetical protein
MEPKVFITYGREFRHKREVVRLKRYFEQNGFLVVTCSVYCELLKRLSLEVNTLESKQPFLLIYNGHGSRVGWENRILYADVAAILAQAEQLMVINQACFAVRMISQLKHFRNETSTSFLAPYDSRGLSYGGVIDAILTCWPQGKRMEDLIAARFVMRRNKASQRGAAYRWGQSFDHLFFPKSPVRETVLLGKPVYL